jgi:hypothetical protein
MNERGSTPDQVIFIHGTGATDSAIRGERWWQFGSDFEIAFSKLVAPWAQVADPFS